MGSRSARGISVSRLVAGDWTAPLTNRWLLEVSGQVYNSESNRSPWPDLADGMIPVQEQNTGMRYRAQEMFRIQDQDV